MEGVRVQGPVHIQASMVSVVSEVGVASVVSVVQCGPCGAKKSSRLISNIAHDLMRQASQCRMLVSCDTVKPQPVAYASAVGSRRVNPTQSAAAAHAAFMSASVRPHLYAASRDIHGIMLSPRQRMALNKRGFTYDCIKCR
jgi:hypothetical protein